MSFEDFCEGGGTIRGVEDAAGTEELSCDNDLGENSELDKLGRKSAICEGRMSTPPLSRQACKKVFTRLETKSVSRDAKAEGGQGGKGLEVTAMFCERIFNAAIDSVKNMRCTLCRVRTRREAEAERRESGLGRHNPDVFRGALMGARALRHRPCVCERGRFPYLRPCQRRWMHHSAKRIAERVVELCVPCPSLIG